MDLYVGSLLLGAVGFSLMAMGGLIRGPHAARFARGRARGSRSGARGSRSVRASSGHARVTAGRAASHLALALTSPRFVFSVAIGAGLTGVLLRAVVPSFVLPMVAIAGGLLFERALVGPLWDSLMRFGSEPALTLESCAGDEAIAVSGFDRNGHGIVSIELDGQVVQMLATLGPEHRLRAEPVRAGARLRIDEVDPARNRCTVSPC